MPDGGADGSAEAQSRCDDTVCQSVAGIRRDVLGRYLGDDLGRDPDEAADAVERGNRLS
jgi:hypothetical protein